MVHVWPTVFDITMGDTLAHADSIHAPISLIGLFLYKYFSIRQSIRVGAL